MTIFLFLVILAVLVLVHEAGHFLVAKFFKIRVDEFGFGFPPRLLSFVRGETRYSLNLIPFGGFVKIFGEDPTEEIKDGERHHNFSHKPRSVQAFVLVAGILGNFLLAWVLISAGFVVGMPASMEGQWGVPVTNSSLTIVEVLPDSPATRAGLHVGDMLVTVGTAQEMIGKDLTPEKVSAFIAENAQPMTIVYTRGKKLSQVTLTPTEGIVSGKRAIGIAMDMMGVVRLPVHRAIFEGAKVTVLLTGEVARSLAGFVHDAFTGEADLKNLAGPVGIAGLVGQARAEGVAPLLSLAALISINLALINLIPFPALDGGRLLFVAIEAVRRKAIPARIAQTANAVGFALLLLFMAFITYHDLARLFTS